MTFSEKRVLIVGLARSGAAAAAQLCALGARVSLSDSRARDQLPAESRRVLDVLDACWPTGGPDELLEGQDLVVISPGVPIDSPLPARAKALGIPVWGEIELAYRLCNAPIAAITGTNGKTTTTALTGDIFSRAGFTAHVVGNIGIPFAEKAPQCAPGDVVIAEISSFQLETIHTFRPRVAAILNITPDHLDRHYTLEGYARTKARIFENQGEGDTLIINGDDALCRELAARAPGRVLEFSCRGPVAAGAGAVDGALWLRTDGTERFVIDTADIRMPGAHNVQNAMAAALIADAWDIAPETIAQSLREFAGVEHRIEFVCSIDDILYYNDSKGTNVDSTIKAVQAMSRPTVLIAGGYDKAASFDELFCAFGGRVHTVVAMGQTQGAVLEAAARAGFSRCIRANDFVDAVHKARAAARPGDAVLLSPACASFDMFRDFEERGNVFKAIVRGWEGSL